MREVRSGGVAELDLGALHRIPLRVLNGCVLAREKLDWPSTD